MSFCSDLVLSVCLRRPVHGARALSVLLAMCLIGVVRLPPRVLCARCCSVRVRVFFVLLCVLIDVLGVVLCFMCAIPVL